MNSNNNTDESPWMTSAQLSKYTGFSLSMIAKMRSQKRIKYHKVGGFCLFNRNTIDEWLQTKEVS